MSVFECKVPQVSLRLKGKTSTSHTTPVQQIGRIGAQSQRLFQSKSSISYTLTVSSNRRMKKVTAQGSRVLTAVTGDNFIDHSFSEGTLLGNAEMELCSPGALKEDALGFSAHRLHDFQKGKLQMIGRSLCLEIEEMEEDELRNYLQDITDSWTPDTVVNKLKKDDKPPNVINIHSLEELILTMQLREMQDSLAALWFWKFSCYACHSVTPKLYKFAAQCPDVTFLKINFDEFPEFCRNVVNVDYLPYIQLYRGSDGLVDAFSIPLTRFPVLRESFVTHNSPRCSLACPMACPFPPPPTWRKILGLDPVYKNK